MAVYGLLLGLQAFPFDDVRYDCIRISGHNMTQAMRAVFVGQSHRRYIGVSTFSNGSDPAAKWDHRCGLARKPDSPQERRHLRRSVLLHRRQRVSVDVVRDVGLCVAEPLRDDLHRNARLQCQGRARVSKSVELDPTQTHSLYETRQTRGGPPRVASRSRSFVVGGRRRNRSEKVLGETVGL